MIIRRASHLNKLQFLMVFSVLLVGMIVLLANPCRAEMRELADADLAAIYAAGFSSFTWQTVGTQDIARADLGIETRVYADIASLKMAHYSGGWDQNWTGVQLGTAANDLVAKGLYIEVGYDTATMNSATGRKLNYVKIGTPSLSGSISGTFTSINYLDNNVYNSRVNKGSTTFSGTAKEFCLILQTGAVPGTQRGLWVQWKDVIQ